MSFHTNAHTAYATILYFVGRTLSDMMTFAYLPDDLSEKHTTMSATIKMTCALLFLLAGLHSNAQPVFSITTIPVDSTTMGTAPNMGILEPVTYLVNHTSNPLALRWQLLTDTSSYAPDWTFLGVADNYLVRAPGPSGPLFNHAVMKTDTISPGDSSVLKLLVWVPDTSPNGSNGIFKIRVFDSLLTQADTAVFRICKGTGCIYPPIYGPGGGGNTATHDIIKGAASFSLYPNPASAKVYLRLPGSKVQTGAIRAEVYDYTGRLLLQQKTDDAIDLEPIRPGIYLVRLYQGDQYLGCRKLNKQ